MAALRPRLQLKAVNRRSPAQTTQYILHFNTEKLVTIPLAALPVWDNTQTLLCHCFSSTQKSPLPGHIKKRKPKPTCIILYDSSSRINCSWYPSSCCQILNSWDICKVVCSRFKLAKDRNPSQWRQQKRTSLKLLPTLTCIANFKYVNTWLVLILEYVTLFVLFSSQS